MPKTTTTQILDIAMQVSRLDRKGRAHILDMLAKEFGEHARTVKPERKKKREQKPDEDGAM